MKAILAAFAALVISLAANAQDSWPSRSVRVIVPSSPGGGTDIYSRIIAQALSDALKQQFVVDNRPGANGNVGAAAAAKSLPDGYNFLVSASPAIVINPGLYKNLPYNAERDFVPVARGVRSPLVLVLHPSFAVSSTAELMALGKREPGTLPFGSAGVGSTTYLSVRMLEEHTGARFLHVPYKGVGPAFQDLLGGQLRFMMADLSAVIAHIRSGKVKALALSIPAPQLPGVPTLVEAGFPVEVFASFMVVAPTGTPAPVVQRLNSEVNRAMRTPAVMEKLNAQALIPAFESPEEFAASLKVERERWADFIRRNNIQPDQ
jgi:tripartite-type tricarboxylate transporter receptor subunit TctC